MPFHDAVMVPQACRPYEAQECTTDAAAAPPYTMTELSPRQREIAAHVAIGESNKQIARALGLSEGTVKRHMTLAMLKLGVTTRTRLAIKVLSNESN